MYIYLKPTALGTSVVDPDPDGSETFCRIRIQKNQSGSEQLLVLVRIEFEIKLE
jgi:hypothetical protein